MKTEQEILNEAHNANHRTISGFTNEQKWYDDHRSTKILGFSQGANWMQDIQPKWIPVTESLPERHQRVMFVVKSDNEWYNGKVYGGVYTDPDFTTPGMGFEATHWMLLPDAP